MRLSPAIREPAANKLGIEAAANCGPHYCCSALGTTEVFIDVRISPLKPELSQRLRGHGANPDLPLDRI
jgi:hypothetical protein